MSFLPKLASSGFFGLGGLLLGSKKKPRLPMRAPPADNLAAEIEANDALRRRRGSAADILTGVAGGEPGPASLGRLVVGT